jgi:predicted transcriptional regulator of viral defense system
MGVPDRTLDEIIAAIAGRRHGVVTRAQLLAAGVSAKAIERRLGKGALIREFPGVYRVGHAAPSAHASLLAAVYACGEGAFLSGRSAAWLLGLVRRRPAHPEVTTPGERTIRGVTTRRSRAMDRRETTSCHGIPVTTVARTLVDLAATMSPAELARAVHEAGIKHGIGPDDVESVLDRRRTAKGSAALRAVLRGDEGVVLSRLERAFLELLRRHHLPLPQTNRRAGGRFVDCRWPEHRLTVELDSYRYHSSRHAFEQDRARERQAYARGDQFRRYTWGDVVERPRPVVSEVRAVVGGSV